MKKFLLALTTLTSLTQASHALIIGENRYNSCIHNKDAIECVFSTTFLLPTMLVGSEKELSFEEKSEMLKSEARMFLDGIITETVLLQKLADATHRDINELAAEILEEK
jgi:hypothetical protein